MTSKNWLDFDGDPDYNMSGFGLQLPRWRFGLLRAVVLKHTIFKVLAKVASITMDISRSLIPISATLPWLLSSFLQECCNIYLDYCGITVVNAIPNTLVNVHHVS